MTEIKTVYYVSSGQKNAMHTLRRMRISERFSHDMYVCNLAATEDLACEKAERYVDAMRNRNAHWDIELIPGVDCELNTRRGRLSIRDTRWIETIESGRFPFGKHAQMMIVDAPMSYVLYFADMANDPTHNEVMQALTAACLGVALERGYIAVREAKRVEIAAKNALSTHVGTIGERCVFAGIVLSSYLKESDFGDSYYINKVLCGTDIIVHFGAKSFGEKDKPIKFRATIKNHSEYKGTKTTQVTRPHFC